MESFDKKSRFWKVTKYVSTRNAAVAFVAAMLFACTPNNLQAADTTNTHGLDLRKAKHDMTAYLENFQKLQNRLPKNFQKS